jgi:hypothetical protein
VAGGSQFEDDILAARHRYRSAKRPFLPELPGAEAWPPEVWNSPLDPRVSRKNAARLCKYGIEKDVERSDLVVANNDDIQSGVVWGLAFRARAACQNPSVMQGLCLSMGHIDEVWMCRAKVSGELVQSVVSNKDTGRDVQRAVFSIEVLNGGAAAGRVTFAKDFLKVFGTKAQ